MCHISWELGVSRTAFSHISLLICWGHLWKFPFWSTHILKLRRLDLLRGNTSALKCTLRGLSSSTDIGCHLKVFLYSHTFLFRTSGISPCLLHSPPHSHPKHFESLSHLLQTFEECISLLHCAFPPHVTPPSLSFPVPPSFPDFWRGRPLSMIPLLFGMLLPPLHPFLHAP